MKIVTVTTLSKSAFRDELTYFSAKDLAVGAIVTVPVRGKAVEALVTEIQEASDMKSELRSSNYALKKISAVKCQNFFQPEFLTAANQTADYFLAALGQTIKSFTPVAILSQPTCRPKTAGPAETGDQTTTVAAQAGQTKIEKFVLQEPDEDRLALYKKLIREAFAQKQSIWLCAPTNADVGHLRDALERGIEDYVVTLRSDDAPKEQVKAWKKAAGNSHSILIIATPLFLSLPRHDLKMIIVERENATAYKQMTRPFIDSRYFIEKLAEAKRAKIVFGDILLRSETIERSRRGDLSPLSPITYRSFAGTQKQILVNQKETSRQPANFGRALSDDLAALLVSTTTNSERWFIFSGRRGLAPLTVCGDCGHSVTCPNCHIPLSLHRRSDESARARDKNYWLCHKCGFVSPPEDKCRQCAGSRLALLGSGTDKIEAELRALLPGTKILRLDRDSATSVKKAEMIAADFYASPGAILIGTEMALFHLREKIENVAASAIDAYFSVPEFRISEKVFNILLRLRQLAIKNFVIQTRNPEEEILTLALRGNSTEFHRRELSERKKLKYPPFSVLIKISVRSGAPRLVEALETLKTEHLSGGFSIIYDSAGGLANSGESQTNLLLRLPAADWPETKIVELLKQLPPSFVINVDPENIF